MSNGRLTLDALVSRTDTTTEHIERLAAAGVIEQGPDGDFAASDIYRVGFVSAMERSGIPLDVFVEAARSGIVSLARYDQFHPEPGAPSDRTLGELRADLGSTHAALLDRLMVAAGIAIPPDGDRLSTTDEALLVEMVEATAGLGRAEHGLTVTRIFGDATRRITETALEVYSQAVDDVLRRAEGHTDEEVDAELLGPWARYSLMVPRVAAWLTQRHLSDAIEAFSVAQTEQFLVDRDYMAAKAKRDPAVAFVDLAGFTRLSEEHGDEAAAAMSLQLASVAGEVAETHGGRLVKLLGDGVLLRFETAATAAQGTLSLIGRLPGAGLPDGHAGIAAGPLVMREGDVFGRTVNLASRLSDRAEAGETLVSERAAADLVSIGMTLESLEPVELRGFAAPVTIYRLVRSNA